MGRLRGALFFFLVFNCIDGRHGTIRFATGKVK